MKRIEVTKMTLTNFKGLRDLSLSFEKETNIHGNNATGKTTIIDAFLWLFFGKDSSGRSDFQIKTLSPDNKEIHHLEHGVEAFLLVDGQERKFNRIFAEKWVKKHGEDNRELSGHTTKFFVDDVPCKSREYQEKVNEILPEDYFKMLSTPFYFPGLPWEKRREVLINMVNITDKDIARGNSDYEFILSEKKNRSLDEYKKVIANKISLLKKSIAEISPRIDEVSKNRVETPEKSQQTVLSEISEINEDIALVEKAITSEKEKFNQQEQHNSAIREKIFAQHAKMQKIEQDIRAGSYSQTNKIDTELRALNSKIDSVRESIIESKELISDHEAYIAELNDSIVELRDEFSAVKNESIKFNEGEFICPTCKRAYDATSVESKKMEMVKNFNSDKERRLSDINSRGVKLKGEISLYEKKLEDEKLELEKLTKLQEDYKANLSEVEKKKEGLSNLQTESIKKTIEDNPEYQVCVKELETLNSQIKSVSSDSTEVLMRDRKIHYEKIDELKNILHKYESIEAADNRISELKNQEKQLAQQISDLEKHEFIIQSFTKERMTKVEQAVNAMFSNVQFKMFESQINGGERPVCEILIDGIPFSDANNAGKINAGIDIINTLGDYYGLSVPIFIDNAESITTLQKSENQIIRLVVDETFNRLTIIK